MLIISSELGRGSYRGDSTGGVCELVAELSENNLLLLISDKLEGTFDDGGWRSEIIHAESHLPRPVHFKVCLTLFPSQLL